MVGSTQFLVARIAAVLSWTGFIGSVKWSDDLGADVSRPAQDTITRGGGGWGGLCCCRMGQATEACYWAGDEMNGCRSIGCVGGNQSGRCDGIVPKGHEHQKVTCGDEPLPTTTTTSTTTTLPQFDSITKGGAGGWGGQCCCRMGQETEACYWAGDEMNGCRSIACSGGTQRGGCAGDVPSDKKHQKVFCGIEPPTTTTTSTSTLPPLVDKLPDPMFMPEGALCVMYAYKTELCKGPAVEMKLSTGSEVFFSYEDIQSELQGTVGSVRLLGPNCGAYLLQPHQTERDAFSANTRSFHRAPLFKGVVRFKAEKINFLQRNRRAWPPLDCAHVDSPIQFDANTDTGYPASVRSTTNFTQAQQWSHFFKVQQGNYYYSLNLEASQKAVPHRGQGGKCMCPDGQIYDVQSRNNCKNYEWGKQLACFGGKEILPNVRPGELMPTDWRSACTVDAQQHAPTREAAKLSTEYDWSSFAGGGMEVYCALNLTTKSAAYDLPTEDFFPTNASYDHDCDFEDYRLDRNGGIPWIWVNGQWKPIGSHYHDENNYGVNIACRKLGYDAGIGINSISYGYFSQDIMYYSQKGHHRTVDVEYNLFYAYPASAWTSGMFYSPYEQMHTTSGHGIKQGYESRTEGEVRYWCAGRQLPSVGHRTQTCRTKLDLPSADAPLSSYNPEFLGLYGVGDWGSATGYSDDMLEWGKVNTSKSCEEGDVLMNHTNGYMPYVFHSGGWVPICSYNFDITDDGATTFCRKLGYNWGFTGRGGDPPEEVYHQDSIMIGRCKPGEELLECSGFANTRTVGRQLISGSTYGCGAEDRVSVIKIWCATGAKGFKGPASSCDYTAHWPPSLVSAQATTTSTTTVCAAGTSPPADQTRPWQMVTCSATQVWTSSCNTMQSSLYDRIVQKVVGFHEQLSGDNQQAGHLVGCYLRMAGHDFMDFNPLGQGATKGGSDGCINFDDPDNAGLYPCVAGQGEFGSQLTITAAYQDFCSEVSLADFIVVAAEALMMRTHQNWSSSQGISTKLDLRSGFKFGRTTSQDCSPLILPNPEHSCSDVNVTFVTNLNLNWTAATALMGVHTVGRASSCFSGYNGFWNVGPDAGKFSNSYYISLLAAGWAPKKVAEGKHQWVRSDIPGFGLDEMMLNSDMCLLFTTDHNVNAALDECCAWVDEGSSGLGEGQDAVPSKCGASATDNTCCGGNVTAQMISCPQESNPQGSFPAGQESARAVKLFAKDEDLWLSEFVKAWRHATTRGFDLASQIAEGSC